MNSTTDDGIDFPREDEVAGSDVLEIARRLDDCYNRLGRHYGPLSRSQRRTLRLLDGGALRVGDIATRLGLTNAGATRMLDKLESAGLARRYREPGADQRQVYTELTDSGARALSEADEVYLARVRETIARLTPGERAELARLLGAIGSGKEE